MDENIKNFIQSIIYYTTGFGDDYIEYSLRRFSYFEGKEYYDGLIYNFPENHPAITYYDKVKINEGEFDYLRIDVCTKIAKWAIESKNYNFNFIKNEEDVEELSEKITNIKLDNIEQFIREKENILTEIPEKFDYCFGTLCRYLRIQNKDSINIDLLKKEAEFFENCKFEGIEVALNRIDEVYKYLEPLYDNLSKTYHNNEEYKLAEIYYKKLIGLLEEYAKVNKDYSERNWLAITYSNFAILYWDMLDELNEKSDDLIHKAIKIKEELVEEYSDKIVESYTSLAIYYSNIAYQYKHDYKKSKNDELKEKYYEFYKKAIFYGKKVTEIDDFKNIEKKIKNLKLLANSYYYINENDKSEKLYKELIEIGKKNNNVELVEEVNEMLKKIKEGRK